MTDPELHQLRKDYSILIGNAITIHKRSKNNDSDLFSEAATYYDAAEVGAQITKKTKSQIDLKQTLSSHGNADVVFDTVKNPTYKNKLSANRQTIDETLAELLKEGDMYQDAAEIYFDLMASRGKKAASGLFNSAEKQTEWAKCFFYLSQALDCLLEIKKYDEIKHRMSKVEHFFRKIVKNPTKEKYRQRLAYVRDCYYDAAKAADALGEKGWKTECLDNKIALEKVIGSTRPLIISRK